MAFRDIKGQEGAVEFFRNSVNRHRLAHAYLFLGAQGLGKTLLAKNLAKFLNCENPIKEQDLLIDSCDACASCRKIDGFNHPDVHWIEPGAGLKKISIEEIRLAQKEVSLKSYEGKFKIFIILEAQEMTEQAANSLLKTLEEPPVQSLIILTSTNISALSPTIISRCQIVRFHPLQYENLKEILIQQYGLKSDDVHFLSAASEGRIGQALSLKSEDVMRKKNRIIDQVCQFRRRLSFDVFNIKDRRELRTQIRYLLNWFRDILIFKAGGLASSDLINADRIERIKSVAASFSFQDLIEILTKIIEAHRLIEQNVNPKIALEAMLTGIVKCRK